jgi:hypothetical protein
VAMSGLERDLLFVLQRCEQMLGRLRAERDPLSKGAEVDGGVEDLTYCEDCAEQFEWHDISPIKSWAD